MIHVVLPVLDEAEAIPTVLAAMPSGYDPIVVDNGSTDGSAGVARSMGARVVFEPRRGFGAACHAGLLAARSDVVCFMDCDASLDPRELPLVSAPVASDVADLVLGARQPVRGAWPWHARVANALLAHRIRSRTGCPITDLGPMRAANRLALIDLDLRDRRCGYPLEMLLRAVAAGWRIDEAPVAYTPRFGQSKISGTAQGTIRAARDMTAIMRRVAPAPAPRGVR